MAQIAILHILLSMLVAIYSVFAVETECVMEQAARRASANPCFRRFLHPSVYAEIEHDVNSLQLLQLRGKSRVAPVCGILWFYHIPKTGGSSVAAWLQSLSAEGALEYVINLRGTTFKHYEQENINFTAFHEEKIRPLLRNMTGKLFAVHHHHRGPGLYGMDSYFSDMKNKLSTQGCSLIRFTVLREPVSQLTSAVNRRAEIWNVPLPNSSARDDFFRLHLEDTGDSQQLQRDNAEVRYTLNNFNGSNFPMGYGGSHEDALKAAEAVLDGFEVVGLTEQLANSIGNVAKLLKLPNAKLPIRKQRSPSYRQYDGQPFPYDVAALIKERTKFDSELYERFKSRILE